MIYTSTKNFALEMDAQDPLKDFRQQFHLPIQANGKPYIYFCGNSLGLQPKSTKAALMQELEDWKNLGVEGHFHAKNPWIPYHEYMASAMAEVVGAKSTEVVVMNTLTVNLHLMMASFYRPKAHRNKILIEADVFPSDKYAVQSQIRNHGFDPSSCLIELKPRKGEACIREEDIQQCIEERGEEIALIILGNTNYYTGQYFDIKKIADWGHQKGCIVGFDCAHAAGNIPLNLHESGCDFAVWCSYKYLNAGPGSIGGVFVHEKHIADKHIPRLEGWWGHNKSTRFKMRGEFEAIPSAEAWQLSNSPILSMAAVWASLKIFQQAGMQKLRTKSLLLTGYLEYLVNQLGEDTIQIITPKDPEKRGCQLSIRVKNANKRLFDYLTLQGLIIDWREPDVIRVAPAPLYNSFEEVYLFSDILKNAISA